MKWWKNTGLGSAGGKQLVGGVFVCSFVGY